MKLKEAVKHYGTQAAIARVLDCTDASVSRWHREPYNGTVPMKAALRLVRDSDGALGLNLRDY